jgi:glycosyltransferase involved in cell wall biosynthesis
MGAPLATAIVAAYNEERHIAECLASLRRQTHGPLEVIVVDDGSRDRTAAVVARFPEVRLLQRSHQGKAPAVNAAAAEAHGEILLFLDGDLVYEPGYVAALVGPIASGDEIGTSHATEFVANPENRWARCLQARAGLPPDRRLVLTQREITEGSIVFRAIRRADFLRVGGFDDAGYLDDQTLFPKVGRRARLVPEAVCRHYNPERLSEVYAAGVWGAHSILLLHGPRALLTYLPPLTLWRALRAGLRSRSFDRFAYDCAGEWGIFTGLLARVGRERGRRRPLG